MTDVRVAVADLVDDRPEFEDDLRELLEVDDAEDAWTFQEIPLDSGQFGEVVSRGIAVETDDGDAYRLADPDAVRAALEGTGTADAATEPSAESTDEESTRSFPTVDRRRLESILPTDFTPLTAGSILGAFLLLVIYRLFPYSSVFRADDVVLSLNDPYYYRYWVELLGAEAGGLLDGPVFRDLPGAVLKGEPLMITTLWSVAELLGDGTDAGAVLAWYPVVSAIVTGVLIYLLATRLSGDRRVGAAAVGTLAITPLHAFRMSVGAADHHAFDYPWLVLTALAVVLIVDPDRDLRSPTVWVGALALGVGVGGQILAWEAGPLLLMPLGLFGAVHVLSVLRSGDSPIATGAPLLVGVAGGALVAALAHDQLGWHTTVVTYSPALLLVGLTGLYATAEVVDRLGLDHRHMAGIEGVGLAVAAVLFPRLLPSFADRFAGRVEFLVSGQPIGETLSVFSGTLGVIFGPLFRFGFVFFLAIPYLAWFTWRVVGEDRARWLILTVYAWFFLLLAVLQSRFAGQLSMFLAVFAGLGFVHLLAWVDAARPPLVFDRTRTDASTRPSFGADDGRSSPVTRDGDAHGPRSVAWPGREKVVAIAFLGILVASMGTIMTAQYAGLAGISDGQYRTAVTASEYSETHDLSHPENYVLSKWSWNRMYNYHVNGQSQSYGFARNNYGPVLAGDPDRTFDQRSGRVGFVVIRPVGNLSAPENSVYGYHRPLFESDATLPPLDHYRVLRVDRTEPLVLVRLLEGATLEGQAAPNETYTLETEVTLEGEAYTYRREVRTDANGSYSVTVPYPSEYQIGDKSVTVEEGDVENGTTVAVDHGRSGDRTLVDLSTSRDRGDRPGSTPTNSSTSTTGRERSTLTR